MKRLITIAILIVALVASMAVMASAAGYTIRAGISGPGANAAGLTATTTQTKAWGSLNPDSPADDSYLALLKEGTDASSLAWTDFYLTAYDAAATSWTYAVWVDNAAVNTSVDFSIWGANASQVVAIAGQTWSVSIDGKEVGTFTWDQSHITRTNPMFTYSITDTTGMVGFENAKFITLSEVPEPAGIIAMLTGVVGLGGFAIRRRK